MAAVTRNTAHPVTPTGYEVNDKGQAKVAIEAGQLVVMTNDTPTRSGHEIVWTLAPTTTLYADGICLQDVAAGGTIDVGIHGEMDGYEGLVPGTSLFPSASTAGGIDTTAPNEIATTPPTKARSQIKAVRSTRIRFCFV